ncbi:hypothetical protein [Singulisphaera acidiphila]|uniref:Uncharacterized protein n=2 Tax=Singulisphaera acidiphila TaxID=466153 RepID=L0DTE4_SINAD|nr:hypothetical protein [Singulisphaera acidiphila]AGA31641.1 hypothetical protein Sinac_7610 [Singulisphaera acidiphila DSM 18658]
MSSLQSLNGHANVTNRVSPLLNIVDPVEAIAKPTRKAKGKAKSTKPERRIVRVGRAKLTSDTDPAALLDWYPKYMAAMIVDDAAEAYDKAIADNAHILQAYDAEAGLISREDYERLREESKAAEALAKPLIEYAAFRQDSAREQLIEAVFEAAFVFGEIGEGFNRYKLHGDPIGVQTSAYTVWITPGRGEQGETLTHRDDLIVTVIEMGKVCVCDWESSLKPS